MREPTRQPCAHNVEVRDRNRQMIREVLAASGPRGISVGSLCKVTGISRFGVRSHLEAMKFHGEADCAQTDTTTVHWALSGCEAYWAPLRQAAKERRAAIQAAKATKHQAYTMAAQERLENGLQLVIPAIAAKPPYTRAPRSVWDLGAM